MIIVSWILELKVGWRMSTAKYFEDERRPSSRLAPRGTPYVRWFMIKIWIDRIIFISFLKLDEGFEGFVCLKWCQCRVCKSAPNPLAYKKLIIINFLKIFGISSIYKKNYIIFFVKKFFEPFLIFLITICGTSV